jgi:hypothetical protein
MQPSVDFVKNLKRHVRKNGSVYYTLKDGKASWTFEVKKA